MVAQPVARSISRRLWRRLGDPAFAGQVEATYQCACMIVDQDSRVAFVVLPEIGDGPLNMVVRARPGVFAGVSRASPVSFEQRCMRLGNLSINVESPVLWDPRPDWDRLRAYAPSMSAALLKLQEFAAAVAPGASLLSLMAHYRSDSPTEKPLNALLVGTVHKAIQELKAGWMGQGACFHAGATRLAGLGSGLTPAGDDFLAGLMLWVWLAHRRPDTLCRQILDAASPRTTRLSEALLAVAAIGECSAPWHSLLEALAQGSEPGSQSAVREVLGFGATSGADALAGFLFMELDQAHLKESPAVQAEINPR